MIHTEFTVIMDQKTQALTVESKAKNEICVIKGKRVITNAFHVKTYVYDVSCVKERK